MTLPQLSMFIYKFGPTNVAQNVKQHCVTGVYCAALFALRERKSYLANTSIQYPFNRDSDLGSQH